MQVKYRNFVFYKLYFFSLKFIGTAFDSLLYDSIIPSHVITESSLILAKCFPFSQLQIGSQV